MKKISKTLVIIVLIISFGCESDDSENVNNGVELTGTWNLTTLVSDKPLDLDDDGVESENLHEETDCIMETIVFNADGTFSGTTSYGLSFLTELQDVVCIDNSDTGTWELNTNILTTTNSVDFSNSFTITLSNDNLSFNQLENLSTTTVIATYERQ